MATELEIKLTLSPEAMTQAGNWLEARSEAQSGGSRQLINHYFDTSNADLNREKIALRVRRAGDQYLQTLKTQGQFVDGAHSRQEWEWPLLGPDLNIGLLAGTPVAERVNLAGLKPVFSTNFERRIVMLDDGQALIECALDSGTVAAADREHPLHELELELKKGSGGQLQHWAGLLAAEVPVFLNLVSKAEQGYALAGLGRVHAGMESGENPVTGLLHGLSQYWLSGSLPGELGNCLEQVRPLARARGLEASLDWLKKSLETGAGMDELMRDLRLGQLQMALLAP